MANIFEQNITAKNVKAIWEADTNRGVYLGEALFPATKQMGLEINLIKGKQGLPVALVGANWDTDVLYRDRIGVSSLNAELPFFKEAYKVSEKLRQQILTMNETYANQLFDRVFDDVTELIDGARVSVERMRMQLLGTGTINIQENGVDKQYDFGFTSGTQAKTESTLWSASGAHPFKQFVARIKEYKTTFKKTAKYAVFGYDAYQALINDADITAYFETIAVGKLAPTEEEIKTFIEQRTGVRIILNDTQYIEARDNTNTPVYFYPSKKFTLFADEVLGETVFGTTPEEIDLLTNGDSNVLNGEIVETGVAITTWKEADPVCVSVKASEVVLPSCPKIDELFIITVLS